MTRPARPYYLLMDSNVWFSERMLKTAVGKAALYALATDSSSILLPEVVQTEVVLVLVKHAAKAADEVRKHGEFLRHVSGQTRMPLSVPEPHAIEAGITTRWKELDGIIVRAPYDMEQARSALNRVLEHALPSRAENEQFRDCCVWEAALRHAAERPVYLITNDSAFYRKGSNGEIADTLRDELKARGVEIELHLSLDRFLASISSEQNQRLEEGLICDAIIEAITPTAMEAAARHRWTLDTRRDPVHVTIRGYATPRPSVVAIGFDVKFYMVSDGANGRREKTYIFFEGSCSYEPGTRRTDDLVISSTKYSIVDMPGDQVMADDIRRIVNESDRPGWRFL